MNHKLPIKTLVAMLINAEKELCELHGLKPTTLIKIAYNCIDTPKKKKANGKQ